MWWRQENYHLGDPKSPDAPPPREEQEADYWAAMNAVAAAPPPPPPPPASKDRAKFWNILDWHKADGSKRPPDMVSADQSCSSCVLECTRGMCVCVCVSSEALVFPYTCCVSLG